jgi:Cu/Zn superoxide dismutase
MEVTTMISYLKRIGLPALGLVVFAGCTPADDAEIEPVDDAEETTQPMEPIDAEPYTARITPIDGFAISATVDVDPNVNDTEISAEFDGLTPGEHAWHIHQGTCAAPGDIIVALTDTETMTGIADPLEANDEGAASATVSVPAANLTPASIETGQYSLHVHEGGPAAPGASVICADLMR